MKRILRSATWKQSSKHSRVLCSDLKNSLVEDKIEKENLRKQIFQLKGDQKNKDNALMGIDKRVKESNGRAAISEGTKNATRNSKVVTLASSNKEDSNLREKLKLLEVNSVPFALVLMFFRCCQCHSLELQTF
ncbi:uncharacterized protein J3R85_012213 [Psidium guajava]|nr:uncharacterized protein J3R85_012213 [Psidium guajava]